MTYWDINKKQPEGTKDQKIVGPLLPAETETEVDKLQLAPQNIKISHK